MKTFKTIIAIILLTLAMATLGYFLWLQPRTPIFAQSINLQEGIETELIITSDDFDNKALVPKGYAREGQTDEIVFKYKILWHSDSNLDLIGALEIKPSVEVFESESQHLVNIKIEHEPIIHLNEFNEVLVRITLTEPKDQQEYNDIVNKKFKIKLSFKVKKG